MKAGNIPAGLLLMYLRCIQVPQLGSWEFDRASVDLHGTATLI